MRLCRRLRRKPNIGARSACRGVLWRRVSVPGAGPREVLGGLAWAKYRFGSPGEMDRLDLRIQPPSVARSRPFRENLRCKGSARL